VRMCNPALGAAECLAGQTCVTESRFGQPEVTRSVCR